MLLNINEKLIINSYWFWADILAVLPENENNKSWLYNNFINLKLYNENPLENLFFYNGNYYNKMIEMSDCPYLSTQMLNFDPNSKTILGKTIMEILDYALANSYYMIVMVNRKNIPLYGIEEDNFHQIMVYGYDKNTEEVYFCDNITEGKYRTDLKCKRSYFESAYYGFNYFEAQEPVISRGVFLLKPCSNNRYAIQLEFIKKQLIEFLDKDNILNTPWWTYGINTYDKLLDCLYDFSEDKGSIKSFCVLHDHKKVMEKRLEMLCDIYEINKAYLSQYHEIVNKSNIIVMLYLKYSICRKPMLIDSIIQYLSEIKEEESVILNEVIQKM